MRKSERFTFTVRYDCKMRLDAYLATETGYTRSFIKRLLDAGAVLLNGSPVKAGHKPDQGDVIEVSIEGEAEDSVEAEDLPLEIVYQDDDVAVVVKPQGMAAHPAAGNRSGTLVNALAYHLNSLSESLSGPSRPGIVHRLDKDTSGLMVVAKTDAAHVFLSNELKERRVKKRYVALCHGNIKEDGGVIKTLIGRHPKDRKKMAVTRDGREAESRYKVLERYGKYTLVEFDIVTGRTHQIRVHAKHIGHPVVGDAVYTKLKDPFGLDGQLLHAAFLGFTHPVMGEWMEFTAPLPAYFESVLGKLRGK